MRGLDVRAFDFLRRRKQEYQITFSSVPGQNVLADLARFCRANETCYDPDPRVHAALEGRREVWLRIQNHLNLTSQQLYMLATGQNINPNEDTSR